MHNCGSIIHYNSFVKIQLAAIYVFYAHNTVVVNKFEIMVAKFLNKLYKWNIYCASNYIMSRF